MRAARWLVLVTGVAAPLALFGWHLLAREPGADGGARVARAAASVVLDSVRPHVDTPLVRLAIAGAPFRRDRRPPRPPPAEPPEADVDAPPPQRVWIPPLRIAGLIVGRNRAVILEGWASGEPSQVMSPGDERDGIAVADVHDDHVILRTADSTWSLRYDDKGASP